MTGFLSSEKESTLVYREVFSDTLAQRYFTPFLWELSTTCSVLLIREVQYIDYVVFGEKDGKQ